MIIEALLRDAGVADIRDELGSVDASGLEVPADWASLKSPENYVGSDRTENFEAAGVPARLPLNHWTISGDWTIGKRAIVLQKAGGRIAYRFHARDLHLVMGPAARGSAVRIRVRIDGQPPGASHGVEVDDEATGKVSEQRLHQLIPQPNPLIDRTFEIEFLDPGVEAFAFTFG